MIKQLKKLPIVSVKSRAYVALDEVIAIVEAATDGSAKDQNTTEVAGSADQKSDDSGSGASGRGNRQSDRRGGSEPT